MYAAGNLDQRITLIESSESIATNGERIESYDTPNQSISVFANVRFREGSEGGDDNVAKVAKNQAVFTIRYRDNINADNWKIDYRGDRYDIHSINPRGRNHREELVITGEKQDLNQ